MRGDGAPRTWGDGAGEDPGPVERPNVIRLHLVAEGRIFKVSPTSSYILPYLSIQLSRILVGQSPQIILITIN